jgi:hypothetical protein
MPLTLSQETTAVVWGGRFASRCVAAAHRTQPTVPLAVEFHRSVQQNSSAPHLCLELTGLVQRSFFLIQPASALSHGSCSCPEA